MTIPRKAPSSSTTLLPVPGRSSAPVSLDPLKRYLAEIQDYPLMDPDEEKKVAREYRQSGDQQAAYRLLTANLRLVVKIAYEYKHFYQNVLDLVQEGNIGLMQAIKRYDPDRGTKLSSYAQYWIRAYIIYFLLANHRLVKIGTTQAQRKLYFNLRKEQDKLIAAGFAPETRLLAERLDVDESTVSEMVERLSGADVPLDSPPPGGEGRTLAEVLGDEAASPEDEMGTGEFRQLLMGKFARFAGELTDERERFLWQNRLVSESPVTLQEVGARFGFSKERARQLEERVKRRFKEFLEAEFGDTVELRTFVNEGE